MCLRRRRASRGEERFFVVLPDKILYNVLIRFDTIVRETDMKKIFFFLIPVLILGFVSAVIADVAETKKLFQDIRWLGHDTFKISDGKTVIVTDPFRLKDKDTKVKADIILITHEHHDHCSPEDITRIRKPDTVIVTNRACAEKIGGSVKILGQGDIIEEGRIRIEAVPAYNLDKKFHPKDKGGLGYIFTVRGKRLYIAGDTDYIPEMKTFRRINIAFLPVSGTYVMSADEAVRAALDIKPDIAVPMHYGTIVGTRMMAEVFAEKLRGKIAVIIMKEE